MSIIIVENIRSAYNVGNIIRTADAFGFEVIISGYSPSPFNEDKVLKTSLGAEKSIELKEFWDTKKALEYAKSLKYALIAAEFSEKSIAINDFHNYKKNIAIVMGNEVDGVLPETLELVDEVVYIPMKGKKESLNVSQAAAIFMRKFC